MQIKGELAYLAGGGDEALAPTLLEFRVIIDFCIKIFMQKSNGQVSH